MLDSDWVLKVLELLFVYIVRFLHGEVRVESNDVLRSSELLLQVDQEDVVLDQLQLLTDSQLVSLLFYSLEGLGNDDDQHVHEHDQE